MKPRNILIKLYPLQVIAISLGSLGLYTVTDLWLFSIAALGFLASFRGVKLRNSLIKLYTLQVIAVTACVRLAYGFYCYPLFLSILKFCGVKPRNIFSDTVSTSSYCRQPGFAWLIHNHRPRALVATLGFSASFCGVKPRNIFGETVSV